MAQKVKVLKVEGVSASYGHISAIRNVSLEVDEDHFVSLIGSNGAGKSTLLKVVFGIHRCERGKIVFMGRDITRKSADTISAFGITFIPEGGGVLPLMTVLENLQLGAYHLKSGINTHLRRVFEQFPILEDRRYQKAGTLSGGERQMLAVGRALMGTPKLLMLDEPTLGLAPLIVAELFNNLVGLNKAGYTILLSEQNARQALRCADRAYVFEKGEIVLNGTGEELLNNQQVHQAYLGG